MFSFIVTSKNMFDSVLVTSGTSMFDSVVVIVGINA